MGITSRSLALLAALVALPLAGQAVQGGALPGPLPLFPADNWWNVDVSAAPRDPDSANYIAHIQAVYGLPGPPVDPPMHPDFGGDAGGNSIYGMPYIVVPGDQPLEQIAAFTYPGESDWGAPGRPPGYPIPVEAKTQPHWIEGGEPGNVNPSGDKHMLIVDRDHRLLFELWNTRCTPTGSATCTWRAGSGAVFALDSNHRRPEGWTSADAAGLAILPGLVRYDEAYGPDPIRHAIRVTVDDSNGHVYPASHSAGSSAGALPMGARLRLKATTSTARTDPGFLKIFQAMKTYGLIVADNGTSMYVQGTYDTRWDNGVLNPAFGDLHASDFEVIQLGWTPPATLAGGPGQFHTLPPCRVLDTRNPAGPYGAPALYPQWERTFTATGRCGIPAGTRAIAANLTVVNPGSAGILHAFGGNLATPVASSISFAPGKTRANNLILGLSSTGTGTFTITNEAVAAVDVIVDANGYFQ